MTEFQKQAADKLKAELASFEGGSKESAIKKALMDALMDFCKQDDEFAQAVAQSKKTLADCAAAVVKGYGGSIPAREAYDRMAGFYFPGARARVQLTIDLCASVGDDSGEETPAPAPVKSAGIVLDLADFL